MEVVENSKVALCIPSTLSLTMQHLQDSVCLSNWVYNPEDALPDHLKVTQIVEDDPSRGQFSSFAIVKSVFLTGGSADAYYFVFRGSQNENDFIADISAVPAVFEQCPGIALHSGMAALFGRDRSKFLDTFRAFVSKLVPEVPVIFTGHSLGGGIALLAMLHIFFPADDEMKTKLQGSVRNQFYGVGVAAPMFIYSEPCIPISGDDDKTLQEMKRNCINIIHGNDVVPRLPKYIDFITKNSHSLGALVQETVGEHVPRAVDFIFGGLIKRKVAHFVTLILDRLTKARELCNRYDHHCNLMYICPNGAVQIIEQDSLMTFEQSFENNLAGSLIYHHMSDKYWNKVNTGQPVVYLGLPDLSCRISEAAACMIQAVVGIRLVSTTQASSIAEFVQLRKNMQNTVLLYKSRVLPVAQASLQEVKEFCEYFEMLDFESLCQILHVIIKGAQEKKSLMLLNSEMHIDLQSEFLKLEDCVENVKQKCYLEKDYYDAKVKENQKSLNNKNWWLGFWAIAQHVPVVSLAASFAKGKINQSIDNVIVDKVANEKESVLALAGADCVTKVMLPALKSYGFVMEKCASEFQAISEQLASLQSAGEKLEKHRFEPFHKKMKLHSAKIIESCEEFSRATCKFKAILGAVDGAPDLNFVQQWVKEKRAGQKKSYLERLKDLCGSDTAGAALKDVVTDFDHGLEMQP